MSNFFLIFHCYFFGFKFCMYKCVWWDLVYRVSFGDDCKIVVREYERNIY